MAGRERGKKGKGKGKEGEAGEGQGGRRRRQKGKVDSDAQLKQGRRLAKADHDAWHGECDHPKDINITTHANDWIRDMYGSAVTCSTLLDTARSSAAWRSQVAPSYNPSTTQKHPQ